MATQDLNSFLGATKEFYEKSFTHLLNRKVMLYDKIKKSAEGRTPDGKYYVFPTHMRAGYSNGSRAAGGQLPTAINETYVQGKVRNKRHYVTVQVDGEAEALTDTQEGAWKKVKPEVMFEKGLNMADQMNRMFYNGGRGILCECSSYNAGTDTVTIKGYGAPSTFDNDDAWAWPTTKHIKVGAYLAWGRADTVAATDFTSASGAAAGYGVVVSVSTASPYNTFVITTLGGADPVADNVFVFGDGLASTSHSYNQESPGLRQIVNDADDDFEEIDTGTYPEWAAKKFVNDAGEGATRALSENLMQQPYDWVIAKSSADYAELIITSIHTKRMYSEIMRAKGGERYVPTKFAGGTDQPQLTFNGGAGDSLIMADKDAPDREMFFLSQKDLTLFQAKPFEWDTSNGGVWKWVSGQDATQAFGKTYCSLGTRNRRAHAVIRDINTTGISY